jgi:hypothetical protein
LEKFEVQALLTLEKYFRIECAVMPENEIHHVSRLSGKIVLREIEISLVQKFGRNKVGAEQDFS